MSPATPMRCRSLLVAAFAVLLVAGCKRDAVDETGRVFRQTKQKKRRFHSTDQVIEEDFVPDAKKQGKHLVRTDQIPELAKYGERFRNQLYEFFPS